MKQPLINLRKSKCYNMQKKCVALIYIIYRFTYNKRETIDYIPDQSTQTFAKVAFLE